MKKLFVSNNLNYQKILKQKSSKQFSTQHFKTLIHHGSSRRDKAVRIELEFILNEPHPNDIYIKGIILVRNIYLSVFENFYLFLKLRQIS